MRRGQRRARAQHAQVEEVMEATEGPGVRPSLCEQPSVRLRATAAFLRVSTKHALGPVLTCLHGTAHFLPGHPEEQSSFHP